MDVFGPYMERITALCEQHQVKGLYGFGSAVRGEWGPDSDVDLLLDLPLEDPEAFSEHYCALEEALGNLFQRPVDPISKRALRNQYSLQELERTKIPLHEA